MSTYTPSHGCIPCAITSVRCCICAGHTHGTYGLPDDNLFGPRALESSFARALSGNHIRTAFPRDVLGPNKTLSKTLWDHLTDPKHDS